MDVARGKSAGDAGGERQGDRERRGGALRHVLERGYSMHGPTAVVTAARAQIHCAGRAPGHHKSLDWCLGLSARSLVLDGQQHSALGALLSPLWGGVGGGGRAFLSQEVPPSSHRTTPSPPLPHKGGGSRLSLRLTLIPFAGHTPY